MAHVVLLVEMFFETEVVLKKLIVKSLLFANVAFVVLLVQMLMQIGQVVKACGRAKFAYRVADKSRRGPVSLAHVLLQLRGCPSG